MSPRATAYATNVAKTVKSPFSLKAGSMSGFGTTTDANSPLGPGDAAVAIKQNTN